MIRTIVMVPTVQGTVRPNLAPPATIDAPERPLTNDDLARAYDMGRDLERADTVAFLRERVQDTVRSEDDLDYALAVIESGKHRKVSRPEPEPVSSHIALGKRIVACRGWRWMEGMLAVEWAAPGMNLTDGRPVRVDEGWQEVGVWLPDLRDAATRGCVIELLREVTEDPYLYLCLDGGDPETGAWHVRWKGNRSRRGRTEGEALVAAWEALS